MIAHLEYGTDIPNNSCDIESIPFICSTLNEHICMQKKVADLQFV